MRANGIADAIIRARKNGKKIIGICGGYQMMGARIEDPDAIEGNLPAVPGLGLLPQCTVIEPEKVTCQSSFTFLPSTGRTDDVWKNGAQNALHGHCRGYEIHMGRTTRLGDAPESPVSILDDGRTDGYYVDNMCWGSYMHGILDNPEVLDNLAEGFDKGSKDAQPCTSAPFDYAAFKEEQYDRLAEQVRRHVNLPLIYQILTKNHD